MCININQPVTQFSWLCYYITPNSDWLTCLTTNHYYYSYSMNNYSLGRTQLSMSPCMSYVSIHKYGLIRSRGQSSAVVPAPYSQLYTTTNICSGASLLLKLIKGFNCWLSLQMVSFTTAWVWLPIGPLIFRHWSTVQFWQISFIKYTGCPQKMSF